MPKPALQLAGKRFNYLTVIHRVHKDQPKGTQKSYWLARCDCGREVVILGVRITSGSNQSCGCMRGKLAGIKNTTHGLSLHPLYAVWDTMIARCHRPKHKSYASYGGRGVHVSAAWREFTAFYADMGPSYHTGLTLDRLDTNAGYSKENCRWATPTEQGNNTRTNRKVLCPDGVTRNMGEAADLYGIGRTTLCHRLTQGWPQDKLFIPVSHANRVRR